MFTGLIEHVGTVADLAPAGKGALLRVQSGPIVEGVRIGDSIAVDGACLTVVAVKGPELSFDVSAETLRVSTVGKFRPGREVNLERALKVGDRLGGHFVLGHVDAVGTVVSLRRAPGETLLKIAAPPEIVRLLIPKGSVALDGISLTVAALDDAGFSVAVIPHTWDRISLRSKKEGEPVNLELDVIGKYVARLMGKPAGPSGPGLTEGFLAEHGFM
jgi:riboflavin synthase